MELRERLIQPRHRRLAGLKLTLAEKWRISAVDPKPTSDALRPSMHEANGALPVSSGARLCTHRDPGLQSARDFSPRLVDFSWRARCRSTAPPLRHLGRCNKASSPVAAVTTVSAISPARSGR